MPSSAYPLLSIASGDEGSTILKFTVRVDGSIDNIGVAHTSGFPRLDEAAVEGAAGWRYSPATRNGKQIACRLMAEVRWMLNTDPQQLIRQGIAVLQPAKPDYPADALKKGETGLVFVGMSIAPDGTVTGARLSRHSLYDDLDQASLRLVSERVHPKPARLDGKPVMTFVPVAVIWSRDPKADK